VSTPAETDTLAVAEAQPLDGLLERVRAVVPLIADRAASAERERKPDDEVIEALKGTGVFRSFVPRRYGGYEIDLALFVDIGISVAEAGPSTVWVTTFYMEHNWLLGLFSDELQDEVFTMRLANALTDVHAAETVLRTAAHDIERHAGGETRWSGLEQQEAGLTIAHVVTATASSGT
jgi:alkylation response protein AidB-like acyl-CoA dehydrogenase